MREDVGRHNAPHGTLAALVRVGHDEGGEEVGMAPKTTAILFGAVGGATQ